MGRAELENGRQKPQRNTVRAEPGGPSAGRNGCSQIRVPREGKSRSKSEATAEAAPNTRRAPGGCRRRAPDLSPEKEGQLFPAAGLAVKRGRLRRGLLSEEAPQRALAEAAFAPTRRGFRSSLPLKRSDAESPRRFARFFEPAARGRARERFPRAGESAPSWREAGSKGLRAPTRAVRRLRCPPFLLESTQRRARRGCVSQRMGRPGARRRTAQRSRGRTSTPATCGK